MHKTLLIKSLTLLLKILAVVIDSLRQENAVEAMQSGGEQFDPKLEQLAEDVLNLQREL